MQRLRNRPACLIWVLAALLCMICAPPEGQTRPQVTQQGDVYSTGNVTPPPCIVNGGVDRCCVQKHTVPTDPMTRLYGMPIHLSVAEISASNSPIHYSCARCGVDSCAPGALCWGCKPRNPGDKFQTGGRPPGQPPDQYQTHGDPGRPPDLFQSGHPCHSSSSDYNNNRRPITDPRDTGGICNLQQLAGLAMKRYKTGFPIAVYDVVNSRSPTYLIALSGMETERRGQATMPGDAYFAWSNIKPLDAYYMAIIDAVKKAIATTSPDGHPIHPTLIIAGHSLGGIEAQNVVAELGSLGYNVVQVVSYGATIQWTVVPGTRYLHVRAPNEALQRWDRRSELGREFSDDCVQVQGIMFSGMGTGAIYGPTGSHNNFAQDSSGLNQRRVPPINTLTSQCYDVELIQAFSAPDMATRVSGGTGCLPPAQVAPKCSFRPKAALPQSCGNNNPMDRGLLNPDENFLKQLAKQMCLVFLVRDSSAPALLWVGKAGYKPKPQDIKGKTLKLRDLQAIGIPPNLFNQYLGLASARGMTAKDRLDLRQKGYKIVGAAEIITDSQGNKFYSDTDLHGVYDMNGNNGWTDNLLSILQCGTLDQGIQHDPHDQWPDRNDPAKAGANWGPQIGRDPTRDCKPTNFGDDEQPCKSVTAIFPDGSTLRVCSLDQMKQLYSAMGVNFKSIYPAF